jgi:hypothetical protein
MKFGDRGFYGAAHVSMSEAQRVESQHAKKLTEIFGIHQTLPDSHFNMVLSAQVKKYLFKIS